MGGIILNLVPSAIQLGCVNSPVFRVENHIGKLTKEPITPDGTCTCHVQQWPTPSSPLYICNNVTIFLL